MSGIFKGNVKSYAPALSSMQISTAILGKPIPILYGRQRVPVNLLDYLDFTVVAQQSGGKGGGTVTGYSYYANLLMGLCEGPVSQPLAVWSGKTQYPVGTISTINVSLTERYSVNSTTSALNTQNAPIAGTYKLSAWISGTGAQAAGFGTYYTLVEGTDYTHSAGTTGFTILAAFWARLSASGLFAQQTVITVGYSFAMPVGANALGNINGTFFNGAVGQSVWSWLSSNHPTHAIGYSGLAYVGALSLALDGSGGMPNISVELDSGFNFSSSIHDANPKDILYDLLTNPRYGANFPWWKCADWTAFSQYCIASGTFMSMLLDSQTAAADVLKSIAQLAISEFAFTDGQLKITPYADAAITGNGVTFTPNLTAQYALTYDNFLGAGGQGKGPLVVARKTPAERYNQVIVKFRNRNNQYNDDQAEAKDEADIAMRGLWAMPTVEGKAIADPQIARNVSQLLMQRSMAQSATFTFTLPFSFCQLEPMDLVTITDTRHSLSGKLVRVKEITENKNGDLDVICEDVPFGHATAIANPVQTPLGYQVNYAVSPGSISAPIIFDAPSALTSSDYELWVAVAGLNPNWGSAAVWVSTDGNTYKQVGIVKACRYGYLSAAVAAGSDPDTTDTFSVDLTTSAGVLNSGSTGEADLNNTLCIVDAGAAGAEVISYSTATLTATSKYNLTTYTRRGVYGTPNGAHANGAGFVRLDGSIFKYAYDPSLIGKNVYLKFTSINIYEGAEEQLASVVPYTYTIRGPIGLPAPPTLVNATFEPTGVRLAWIASTSGDVSTYEIRSGASWATGTKIAQVKADNYFWAVQPTAVYTLWVASYDAFGNYSTAVAASVNVVAPTGVQQFQTSVVDNNVLFFWQAPSTGSLPIKTYEIRRGSTWAGATVIGQNGPSTFFTYFEQTAGTFTYWCAAVDLAGNYGTPVSVSCLVNQPPDYILRADIFSTLSGTLTNAVTSAGTIVLPVDTATSWSSHFSSHSWASPQDQITAGYPIYIEPSVTTASYEEVIDYGTVLPATTVLVTMTANTLAGTVTATPNISTSPDNITYTAIGSGQWSALVTGARYVKVHIDFAASGSGTNLLQITALETKLSIKQRRDSGGPVTAGSSDTQSAGPHSGNAGTWVPFNYAFLSAMAPIVVPVLPPGTGIAYPVTTIIDYTAPANPTGFAVLFYDKNGTRIGLSFTWQAAGC